MATHNDNQPLFENAVKDYLESCTSARLSQNIELGIPEMEVRFGQERSITKINYDFDLIRIKKEVNLIIIKIRIKKIEESKLIFYIIIKIY